MSNTVTITPPHHMRRQFAVWLRGRCSRVRTTSDGFIIPVDVALRIPPVLLGQQAPVVDASTEPSPAEGSPLVEASTRPVASDNPRVSLPTPPANGPDVESVRIVGTDFVAQLIHRCDHCDETFKSEHGLKIHTGRKHKTPTPTQGDTHA